MSEVTSNILIGDVLTGLATLPDASIHCCVTSPPYWGLRNYGKDGQLGLERTPEEYVSGMVEVFREVKRVLRNDGTLWLNIGDSYAAAPKNRTPSQTVKNSTLVGSKQTQGGVLVQQNKVVGGLKSKDLVGIPWMLAFALRADGWYLRQDIIWRKPGAMPESVQDRCSKSHEHIFLLSKSKRYFYDNIAIAEDSIYGAKGSEFHTGKTGEHQQGRSSKKPRESVARGGFDGKTNDLPGRESFRAITKTKNRRDVWDIATRSFKGSHFACYPPALVEPCILAGTSAHGCCQECGAPWKRITSRTKLKRVRPNDLTKRTGEDGTGNSCGNTVAGVSVETLGWEPTCTCFTGDPIPCTVLDPFSGSGTTGAVSNVLGRNYVGTELNEEYAAMWDMRLADVQKWWAKKNGKKPRKKAKPTPRQGGLF